MCLQWCFIGEWLIDNDIPCADCPLATGPADAGASATCATCRHRQETPEGAAICVLTRAPLPQAGWCCHHNARRDAPETIPLADVVVAPWVLDAWRVTDAADLLAVHPNEIAPQDAPDGPVLALDDLALPLVYGVVSTDWDAALRGAAATWDIGTVELPPAHLDALLALFDAQHGDDPQMITQVQAEVDALLEREPLDDLADPWRRELGELWAMMHPLAQFDAQERDKEVRDHEA